MLDQVDERLAEAMLRKRAEGGGSKHWPRRAAALGAGLALIVAGIPMLVLPGPGVLSILFGLSVLAGQFAWARRLLMSISFWARQKVTSAA